MGQTGESIGGIMAKVTKKKLYIPQGTSYRLVINYGADLTDYVGRMQMRSSASSDVILFQTPSNGLITITPGEETSLIQLDITAEVTTAWDWVAAVYDIEIVSPEGAVTRVLQGSVKVDPEVTR